MQLPPRASGDVLLPTGELTDIRRRLRRVARRHDLASVIACAFDHRTRMLPFIYADTRLVPAGPRAIGSALADAGFGKTRIILQQWSPNVRPSRMRLDGRVPDLLLISSMSLHTAECRKLIRDARRIDPARRPLIVVGGSVCIYEPWMVFSGDPADPCGADVAVTGEEYVFLNLLEVLLSARADGEPMRSAFVRARDSGALDDVPGLVYPLGETDGLAEELVDTGIQRLAGDLDALPDPAPAFAMLEPPGDGAGLASRALPDERVGKIGRAAAMVMTLGCRFACPYCPIPAYNQKQYRAKSGRQIADEMGRLFRRYGIRYHFGADDNFFNDPPRTLEIIETLARAEADGHRVARKGHWGTEATVHDAARMAEHFPLMRRAGMRGLWMGVEDMTASLVKKGQSVVKTTDVFRRLRAAGICPMAMMMHHDAQPLYTPGRPYGLLNQVRLLRRAGAVSMQVLMITPSAGSKSYVETFTSGMVYASVGGRPVEPHLYDGNFVIASRHPRPWAKQFNLMAAYLYFYNPLRLLVTLVGRKDPVDLKPAGMQLFGILGLVQTIRRTLGWAFRLMRGDIRRHTAPPASTIPMRAPDGSPASHALPGTPRAPRDAPGSP